MLIKIKDFLEIAKTIYLNIIIPLFIGFFLLTSFVIVSGLVLSYILF